MSPRQWLERGTVRAQALALRACLSCGPARARPVGRAVAAGLAGAALLLAWQAPSLQQERAQARHRVHQLQGQLQALEAQGSQAPAAPQMPGHEPAASTWHWQRLAADAGLQLLHLKPLGPHASDEVRQVHLRLRGRYAQHGAWMAALARQPMRLISYELQAGDAGLHLADLVIELPGRGVPALVGVLSPRLYQPAPHLDPLGTPVPPDPMASMPAPWRAEFERPRQWLEGAALDDLALAGTLRRGQEWWALIRWDRMVHSVREGDYLGRDLGRVERIDEQGLWLREIVRAEGGTWGLRQRHWRVGDRP